ncbi:MAG: hypothetical protein Q8M02_12780 [Candidatus Didemnitutus sp.]|nr:hypothetical protein [Candidatus Didemnitutus sp.]
MNALLALWLPILLSAVVVFVISSLIHMVFKWHAPEYRQLANEDAVRDAIRAGNPTPGQYAIPHCADMKAMGSEPMMKKYQEGPVGFLLLAPNGPCNIGKSLLQWFLMGLGVTVIGAFLATQLFGLDPARAMTAAKLIGAVSFLSFGMGTLCESIWMARPWTSSAKFLLDAALYACGTAAVFYWLWP